MANARCHSERPHYARGYCRTCYKSQWLYKRGVLPCDRARYAVTVAELLAVYGVIVVLDWLARVTGRGPAIGPEGRYPFEE